MFIDPLALQSTVNNWINMMLFIGGMLFSAIAIFVVAKFLIRLLYWSCRPQTPFEMRNMVAILGSFALCCTLIATGVISNVVEGFLAGGVNSGLNNLVNEVKNESVSSVTMALEGFIDFFRYSLGV